MDEFKGFLEGVQAGLGDDFAQVLWDRHIRSTKVLTHAQPEDLACYGIHMPVARAIIKRAKDLTGEGMAMNLNWEPGGTCTQPKPSPLYLVITFAQLVPHGFYTYMSSEEDFSSVLWKACQLQRSRKEEFARALTDYAQHTEPDQGYELREDLRMQLAKDKRIAEHDAVVMGRDKAYVGSHQTHAKGAAPVKEIAERCIDLAKLTSALPAVVKPAFMLERVEPGAEPSIKKACTDLQVVRFRRSGRAIQVVSRMGAAGRLLRF